VTLYPALLGEVSLVSLSGKSRLFRCQRILIRKQLAKVGENQVRKRTTSIWTQLKVVAAA